MKPKHYIRLLKREAEKLPKETYSALHKLSQPRFQDKEGNLYEEQIEGTRPVWKYIEEHVVNHARRVKKLFKRYGQNAVDAYFFVKGNLIRQDLINEYNRTHPEVKE